MIRTVYPYKMKSATIVIMEIIIRHLLSKNIPSSPFLIFDLCDGKLNIFGFFILGQQFEETFGLKKNRMKIFHYFCHF